MSVSNRHTIPSGSPVILALVVLMVSTSAVRSEVRLPQVFGDHMVLQRDMPVRIWGWADPAERVTVTLDDHKVTAVATKEGAWEVFLPTMKAGGPHVLTVHGAKNTLTVRDVLVGEVWFCSGQSNMALGVLKSRNPDKEIKSADHLRIRLLTAPTAERKTPADDIKVQWMVCTPRTISYFSATAYYFGREIQQHLKVPVGLVVSAVNGTRIEPWTPAVGVRSVKELAGKDKPINGDLYNGMIHPFTPYTFRGVIWYQGEGNVGDGMWYYHRMRALIQGWRKQWGREDLPFYYVQLTPLNWGGKPKDQHAELWEAQTEALRIPHTGMVVTNDIGNIGDAHPRNKQDVGKRLALWARAKTYGEKGVTYSGPLYRSMKVEGRSIRIQFDHAHGGLASRNRKPLTWFTIAGKDGKYYPAEAKIEGNDIVVSSKDVKDPVHVRFAWHQNAEPNLMNGAGLPASTFRTDRGQAPK